MNDLLIFLRRASVNLQRRLAVTCSAWLGRIRGKHLCEESGCNNEADCYQLEDELFYYCHEHAQRAGFCWGCGGFWAGIESFDFSRSGLCSECDYNFRADAGEFDEDDEIFAP